MEFNNRHPGPYQYNHSQVYDPYASYTYAESFALPEPYPPSCAAPIPIPMGRHQRGGGDQARCAFSLPPEQTHMYASPSSSYGSYSSLALKPAISRSGTYTRRNKKRVSFAFPLVDVKETSEPQGYTYDSRFAVSMAHLPID